MLDYGKMLPGYDVLLEMDVIEKLGGVTIGGDKIQFFNKAAVALKEPQLRIEDKDFVACFNSHEWEVNWRWQGERPVLKNRISKYDMPSEIEEKFDEEVNR